MRSEEKNQIRTGDRSLSCYNPAQLATPPGSGYDKREGGLRVPLFGSDESVKSVINYSISVDSVCSVDYLFSTEVTEGHGEANENDRSLEGVLCPQADGVGTRIT